MRDRFETFRDCRTTIPSSLLKVSNLYTIPYGFCGFPNDQNRMCELYTFSQIRSHSYVLFFCIKLSSKPAIKQCSQYIYHNVHDCVYSIKQLPQLLGSYLHGQPFIMIMIIALQYFSDYYSYYSYRLKSGVQTVGTR